MIAYLKGKVIGTGKDNVVLDVNGVGYLVHTSEVIPTGKFAEYYIYTHVREDALDLYGFSDRSKLDLFKLLLGVSGVGPKVAMAILNSAEPDKVYAAVSKADVSFFKAIPGIGKKGSQKIIIELKGKVGSVTDIDLGDEGEDLVEGLTSMGFDRKQIRKVIVKLDPKLPDEQKLREAIKLLGKK
ncbi:Holliday junction branch migration protein RuvA [Candidatus Woesebacteria bacterium]|nr:Holliday junction branch migration protein RuvA [Candidatus Woesebacteria bacterium]